MVSWRLSETCARDNWIPKREPAGFGNSAWQSQISQRNQESQRQNVLDSKEKFCFRYLGVWVPNSRTLKCPRKKASFKSSQSWRSKKTSWTSTGQLVRFPWHPKMNNNFSWSSHVRCSSTFCLLGGSSHPPQRCGSSDPGH